jgi:hypothetical protein
MDLMLKELLKSKISKILNELPILPTPYTDKVDPQLIKLRALKADPTEQISSIERTVPTFAKP